MKKLIFSAIALVAFTATSFATEGKKELPKKEDVKTEVKTEVKAVAGGHLACTVKGWVTYIMALQAGFDEEAAVWQGSNIAFLCEAGISMN